MTITRSARIGISGIFIQMTCRRQVLPSIESARLAELWRESRLAGRVAIHAIRGVLRRQMSRHSTHLYNGHCLYIRFELPARLLALQLRRCCPSSSSTDTGCRAYFDERAARAIDGDCRMSFRQRVRAQRKAFGSYECTDRRGICTCVGSYQLLVFQGLVADCSLHDNAERHDQLVACLHLCHFIVCDRYLTWHKRTLGQLVLRPRYDRAASWRWTGMSCCVCIA